MSHASIPKSDLQKALVGKFAFEPVPGARHEAYTLKIGGRRIATTRFSRGLRSEDLGPTLLRQIAGQLRLAPGSLSFLRGMVICTKSWENYLQELRDGGFLG